jgi:dihydroorotate dehydrogenase
MKQIPEILLSNGRFLNYVIASGALAFDGKGWFWERILVWLGLIRPEFFTVFLKTLTRHPRKGNLRWWCPWYCVALIKGGAVNKVGLTNMGIEHWYDKVKPKIDFRRYSVAGSIFGSREELVEMARMLDNVSFVALEVNYSCPNTGHALSDAAEVIDAVKAVKAETRHPVIVKVSVDQPYLEIAAGLVGIAEAISINSVPWKTVFGEKSSPLSRLEKKVGGGGGGVSGYPAQELNWKAVRELAKQGSLPVIGPSIMEYDDMAKVRSLGAQAVSFGTIHLPSSPFPLKFWTLFTNPCKPTQFVIKEQNS